ncbi:MAG: MFS transporter [Capsulimonadales bacterium]|nr:MFS transporter [Capsulimonadales bacterium]
MANETGPTALSRPEVLRGLKVSIWEGIWATVWMVLTTGAFQTGFALLLGANPFALGLMAGLPAAVNLLQLPASLYVERRGERRTFVGFTSVAGRLLWIPILLIPFFVPREAQLIVFLALLTVSSALLTINVPAWTSWMSDLVPPSSRGEYFARRNMLAGIVAMVVPLPAGLFLDQGVKYGRFDPRLGFAVLFGIAAIAALGAFSRILRQPEPPMARNATQENVLRSMAAPLHDRAFRPFLLFSALTVFGQTVAGQFFTSWQLDEKALNLPYFTVQVLAALASGTGLLSTPFWGYLADKYGGRPVLIICTWGTIVSPLLWTLTHPDFFWWNVFMIVLINACAGTVWAGVGLTQFNLLLSTSAPENRGTYVAMFSAANGIVGFLSPILGGLLMALLEPFRIDQGVLLWNNYKWMFLLTAAIRIGCSVLATRLPTEESTSTWYVLGQLRMSRPVSSYVRARRLTQPTGEEARSQTVGELADLRSPLAVEELTSALDDVSLTVRQRAAEALGRIREARAVPALAAKLNDPAAGIGELAAEALGAIGSREATHYLAEASAGPDASVRLASLRALARIADPEAVPALVRALDVAHPSRCELACAALNAIGPKLSTEQAILALPRLLYLLSQEVDRGMRFAAARTLASLAECFGQRPEAYDRLRERLAREEDPAVLAQESIALVRIGKESGRSVSESLVVLLPVLNRIGGQGLAYKQTLDAIADLALTPGTFYPYLGLAGMARDESVHRLLGEIRRKVSASDPGAPERIAAAMEAFAESEGPAFFAALAPYAVRDQSAASRLYDALRQRGEGGYATPEELLLALLLLRSAQT